MGNGHSRRGHVTVSVTAGTLSWREEAKEALLKKESSRRKKEKAVAEGGRCMLSMSWDGDRLCLQKI